MDLLPFGWMVLLAPVRRGWMLGSEAFPKELLGRMSVAVGLAHCGAELRESEEEKAVRIIAQEIQRLKFRSGRPEQGRSAQNSDRPSAAPLSGTTEPTETNRFARGSFPQSGFTAGLMGEHKSFNLLRGDGDVR